MPKSLLFKVFKPGSALSLAYVPREDLNKRLVKEMNSEGVQIVIYGETQSGKTTLIENTYRKVFKNRIRIVCDSRMSIQSIVDKAIEELGVIYEEETTKEQSIEGQGEGEIDLGFWDFLKLKIGITGKRSDSTKKKPVVPYQADVSNLAEALNELETCLIIDDFHRLPDNERLYLSELLKVFGEKKSQILAIGIAESAKELIEKNRELSGRLSECFVPVLQDEEIRQIILKGTRLLNVSFSEKLIDLVVSLSMNNGVNCHDICLDICHHKDCLDKAPTLVELNGLDLRETLLTETFVSRRGEFMDRRDKVIGKREDKAIQFLIFQVFTSIFNQQKELIDPALVEHEINSYDPVGNYDYGAIYRNALKKNRITIYDILRKYTKEEGGRLLEEVDGGQTFKVKDMLLLGFVYLSYELKLKEHWGNYEIEFPIYRNTNIGRVLEVIGSNPDYL